LNGCLLDTNVALLATFEPERLPRAMRRQVETQATYISTVSYWEVVLKSMKGKLAVGDPRSWWRTALADLSATALGLTPGHVAEICTLPPIHADPFDRALVAQAVAENLTLATTDSHIKLYASDRLRIV